MRPKSRKIPFIEYFENLQKEYIVAELRSKIYPSEKDKKYYREREMLGKRTTIEDISSKNNLPNIFNCPSLKQRYYNEIFPQSGLPNFIYRNEEDQKRRGLFDVYNYFAKDICVSVVYNDCCMRGRIVKALVSKKKVIIYVFDLEKELSVDFDKVARYDLI